LPPIDSAAPCDSVLIGTYPTLRGNCTASAEVSDPRTPKNTSRASASHRGYKDMQATYWYAEDRASRGTVFRDPI